MSDYGAYDDAPRRSYNTRLRPRGRNEPEYVEETVFVERGKGPPPRDLVYRTRDREDSIEDIPRAFPPPRGGRAPRYQDDYDAPPPRRAQSQAGRRPRYDDDDYDDYAAGAGGAAAGYAAGRAGRPNQRPQRRRDDYYSDDDRSPRRKEKKSGVTGLLEGLGLGGIAGALTGERSRSRGRDRDDRYDDRRSRAGSRSRSGDRQGKNQRQWAQAAQAAFIAGAVEALRARNEPGEWTGEKGKRIATAAIAAGGVDKLIDRNPDVKSKRHLVEAVLGGLAANRLANGPVQNVGEKEAEKRGRSASRSRSRAGSRGRSTSTTRGREAPANRSGLEGLLAGGAVAAAGKAIWDRVRSKSRPRKSRSSSRSSYDSRQPSRRRGDDDGYYNNSRGVGPAAGAVAAQGNFNDGQQDRGRGQMTGGDGQKDKKGKRDSSSSSNSSLDSITLERERKRMRGKEYVTAGLASIATIHAAHGVYQSMEASDKRHKMVQEGEMTPEEARKKRSKAWLQDAAAVGIAALGIKGAYSEWKEMNEQRHEIRELEERKMRRSRREEKRMKEQERQARLAGLSGSGGGGYQGGGGYGGGGGGYGGR